MAISQSYRDFLIEQLAPLGPIAIRRMFGGAGVFLDGLMFALIVDDTLYFKADSHTLAMFEAEDMPAFVYERQGKSIALSYRRMPERLHDEPDDLIAFAKAALAAARRAAKGVPGKITRT